MVHGTASSITSKFADNIHKFSVFEVPEPGFWKAIIRLPDGVFQVSKFPFPQYGDEEEVDRAVWDKTGLYPVEILWPLEMIDGEERWLTGKLSTIKNMWRTYSESGEIARWIDNFIDDVDRLTQEVQQGHSEFRNQLNVGLGAGIIGRIEPKLDTFYKKGRELSDTFTHGLDDLDMAISYLNSNDQSNIHSSFDKLLKELDDMRRTLGILQAQKGSIFYNEADKIKMFAEELYNFSDIIIQPNKKEIQHDNIATWNRWTFDILDKDTPRNDYVPGQIVLDTYKGYPVAEAISFTKPSHMKDKSSVGFFRSSLSQLKKWLPSINEIEGSRSSGAKTVNPFQSRRPAQTKRVSNRANFKYEEVIK